MAVSIDDKYIDLNPLVIATDTLLKDAIVLIAQTPSPHKTNCLLVVAAQKPVGILTQSDVVRLIATETDLATTTVKRVMTQPVHTMLRSQCQSISSIWLYLKQHSINYLPILDDESKLIGVVNFYDLCRFFPFSEELETVKKIEGEKKELKIGRVVDSSFLQSPKLDLKRFFAVNSMQCVVGFDSYFKHVNTAFDWTLGFSQEELLAETFVSSVYPQELTATNELLKLEIAERKQTEQDLRENQQKLAGILDNADEAIIAIDRQQQIQLFNQGAEKIFGYRASEVMGQPLDILLPEVFRRIHRQHVRNFGLAREQSRKMAERSSNVFGRRKNGHEFQAEASIAKLQTKSGILFTVMLKDISEQQQTLRKLQASEALLAKAEQIAKIGSWEYDHKLNRRSWSEALFNILGFDKNAPIPSCREILDRVHPEDRLLVKKTLRAGHRQGQAWELNYRLLLPNGTLKYIESRGEPTVDSEGKIVKVLETIMDVSDRVQAEQSLQRSEEQLKLITDALPILIAYVDKTQCYRYNNRTYETWFGMPRSSLQGLTIQKLFGRDNYQKMLPYIEMALTGKEVSFETQLTAENGSLYWMSTTYIPDRDLDGKVKGFFSMVEDITERKTIEQMKSEFVSIASHEMRTPLTSIHGVLKLLCADRLGKLSEPGSNMADMALRNSDRLVHLVGDILDLERMESGRDEIIKTICNSSQLIQQAIDTVSTMAIEQKIIIKTHSESIEFAGDCERLTQTLTNLLSNAIKFSPANGIVAISSRLQDNNILFLVRDRGRGIPADKLETIFERFQQVDASDSRKKGGTGLGLAICHHIIEQHKGKIWVESIFGQGSTFYFTIPMQ